jgi:nucleoside-diphosphate-sugar epimerase
VCFAGTDESGVDESRSYPVRYLANYPRTKAIAERRVLAANGPRLATIALRPHLIWGPGDPHLVPRVLERARAGRLRLVGSGNKRVDSTYIDNAAKAHLDAADALLAQGRDAPAAGRAYYISNGEPIPMRELINRILQAGGLPPITRSLHPAFAYAAGAALEAFHALFRPSHEPVMTRFVARQLATEHWYRLDAARQAIGYRPHVSLDDGMRRLAASLASEREAHHG